MNMFYYCDDKFDTVISLLTDKGWKRDHDESDPTHRKSNLIWTNLVSINSKA